MRSTIKGALALLAVGALALSGCTSGGAEKTGTDALTLLRTESAKALQTALTKTKDAKTVGITMDGTVDGEKIKGSGAVQYGDNPRAEFTSVDGKGESTLTRIVGTTIYTEFPAKERAEMDGKRWLKLDLAALAKVAGGDQASAEMLQESSSQLRDLDPSEQVKSLIGDAGLKVVGEEKIDGVDTVHYSRTQTPEEFMAQLGERLGQKPEAKAIEALKKSGVKDIKIDVWVDEKYQPRKARTVMGKSDMTVNYQDYGKPVSVEEPAAAKTADFAAMLQQIKDLSKGLPS